MLRCLIIASSRIIFDDLSAISFFKITWTNVTVVPAAKQLFHQLQL